MALSRRQFFALSGASAAGTFLAGAPFKKLYAREFLGQATKAEGFGSLQRDPNGIFDLPPGFQYRAFSRTGETMTDGNIVPSSHDGMASFDGGRGKVILVRNHELDPDEPFDNGSQPKFDPGATGGTVTLAVGSDRRLIEHYASLSGTLRNCAGGPIKRNSSSSMGSWLSCEETLAVPDSTNNLQKRHGYVFEVPADARGVIEPVPLTDMGRFLHEAVAEDPNTGFLYQTNDDFDELALFYRFRPNKVGNLREGGVLEALKIKGMPGVITSNNPNDDPSTTIPVGEPMPVEWIRIEQPDPPQNGEQKIQREAIPKGAAQFNRGEGIWYGDGDFFFNCTDAGPNSKGQVWRYSPENETLELLAEPADQTILESPDNITVAPWGDLFICEDGDGTDRLLGLTQDGKFYEFGRNALNDAEIAGVNFSPDGRTMFINAPHNDAGVTLAVWGPWDKINRSRA